ncbi:hypothetical protein GW17_00044533, partial [Ensete ventricosum]
RSKSRFALPGEEEDRSQPREGERRRERRRGEPGFLPASCDPSPVGDFFSPWGEKKRLPTWGERMRRRRRARAGRKNVSPRGENERGDLTKAYFAFMEVLFSNHISFILNLDTNTFLNIIGSLEAGLKGLDTGISSQVYQCASAMDNLATFYFNHITFGEVPASPASMNFTRHIAECPNLFTEVH